MFRIFLLFPLKLFLGGIIVILLIGSFYTLTLQAVLSVGSDYQWKQVWQDSYLQHVVVFSFSQAFLSALLSMIIGLVFARAFFYQKFWGKSFLLKVFSLTFVLPALVVVLGLLGIYGHSGWLANFCILLGVDWKPNIYGLSGILIAHLFFNIPLASRVFLQALSSIPNQQRQLGAQLMIRGWQFIRIIEWSYIRPQILPTFALIFMLCFTSFTIVLTLGGGPRYTTLEVAIYQAILFEFDLPKAAIFAVLQCLFCIGLLGISSLFSSKTLMPLNLCHFWQDKQSSAVKIWQVFCLTIVLSFLLLPLIYMIVSGLQWDIWKIIGQNMQLWQAFIYSLIIAPSSALCAIIFSLTLLFLARYLAWRKYRYLANMVTNIGMIVLAIPTLVVALGLFIYLQNIKFQQWHLFLIVVLCNSLVAMPFIMRTLSAPMLSIMQYEQLCQSLGMRGWKRWYTVEWPLLSSPIRYAFALACALSLGDFTAIALFGNQEFTSLPYLLYQQLGSYQINEASVTALILLLLCALLFLVIEKHNPDKTNT